MTTVIVWWLNGSKTDKGFDIRKSQNISNTFLSLKCYKKSEFFLVKFRLFCFVLFFNFCCCLFVFFLAIQYYCTSWFYILWRKIYISTMTKQDMMRYYMVVKLSKYEWWTDMGSIYGMRKYNIWNVLSEKKPYEKKMITFD